MRIPQILLYLTLPRSNSTQFQTHCWCKYSRFYLTLPRSNSTVLLLMKKDPSLSCKASGRALLPRPLRTDVRMQLIALQLTNALKESTTGWWPRIYFFQCREVVTGWQLTADRVSVAGYLRGWHQLAVVVLIRLGAVVCGCTRMRSVAKRFAKNK